jgi:rRNA maturation endonuclease Nob1
MLNKLKKHWKKEKDANRPRELTILSTNYKPEPANARKVEMEIFDDLRDEETKIIISETCIDTSLITGIHNAPEPLRSPLSKYESEVKGENGKSYWLIFAEEHVLEKGRAKWQEEKKSIQEEMEILEKSGHYEMAAMYCETLAEDFKDERLYDKARELRDKARGLQINVNSININELIKQLKETGGAVAYHCPTCGGNLKLDGNPNDKCGYCGSPIEKVNLPDILKVALH